MQHCRFIEVARDNERRTDKQLVSFAKIQCKLFGVLLALPAAWVTVGLAYRRLPEFIGRKRVLLVSLFCVLVVTAITAHVWFHRLPMGGYGLQSVGPLSDGRLLMTATRTMPFSGYEAELLVI